jgi:hypothetical protein
VNVTKEIGSFIKIKNNGIQPLDIKNAKNMDIDMERNFFEADTDKKRWIWWMFPRSQFYYYSGLAYNQLAQFKSKRNVGNGTGLSCRRH